MKCLHMCRAKRCKSVIVIHNKKSMVLESAEQHHSWLCVLALTRIWGPEGKLAPACKIHAPLRPNTGAGLGVSCCHSPSLKAGC